MMKMIEHEKKVDIFNFVLNMRHQRNLMVQTEVNHEYNHNKINERQARVANIFIPQICLVVSLVRLSHSPPPPSLPCESLHGQRDYDLIAT